MKTEDKLAVNIFDACAIDLSQVFIETERGGWITPSSGFDQRSSIASRTIWLQTNINALSGSASKKSFMMPCSVQEAMIFLAASSISEQTCFMFSFSFAASSNISYIAFTSR